MRYTGIDHNPFGMLLVDRNWQSTTTYKYGFNGKENVDDVYGNDIAVDFGARIYDVRIGRFFSVDIFSSQFSSLSPYLFASNSPISAVDVNGDSTVYVSLTGEILLVTFDRQPNAIVIIENVRKFNKSITKIVQRDGSEALDGDITSAYLRRQGVNYKFDEIFAFDDKYKSYGGEAGTCLMKSEGSTNTTYDSQIIEYSPSWDKDYVDVTKTRNSIRKKLQFFDSPNFHIHPTYNDGTIPGPSGTNNGGEVNTDMERHNNNTNSTFNIVVDLEDINSEGGANAKRSIYFYNYNGKNSKGVSFKINRDVYSSQKGKTAVERYLDMY